MDFWVVGSIDMVRGTMCSDTWGELMARRGERRDSEEALTSITYNDQTTGDPKKSSHVEMRAMMVTMTKTFCLRHTCGRSLDAPRLILVEMHVYEMSC